MKLHQIYVLFLYAAKSVHNSLALHDCIYYVWIEIRAVQLITYDYNAHLVSKAGSVIGTKSPLTAFGS